MDENILVRGLVGASVFLIFMIVMGISYKNCPVMEVQSEYKWVVGAPIHQGFCLRLTVQKWIVIKVCVKLYLLLPSWK